MRQRDTSRLRGFTLIELMIVVAIIAIIAAMAIPSLQNARKAGNEVNAIGWLKMVISVNEQYRIRFLAYPTSATDLETAGFISNANPAGYTLGFSTSGATWVVTADPTVPGTSGDRYFRVDQTGVIRFASTGPATASSPSIDG